MNRLQRHGNEYLKAVAETFFSDNPYFGAGLLILFLMFDQGIFACGVLASLIGHAYTVRYSTPKTLRHFGLITLNCFFFGIAMASLFQKSPQFYLCLVLGAAAVPLATKAAYEVLQHWKLSVFILPYILAVWVIWLCGRGAGLALMPSAWPDSIPTLPALHPGWDLAPRLAWATFESIGRLLFLPDPFFGAAVLGLVTIFYPRRGLYFLAGTVLATLVAFTLSAGTWGWEHGFFSYSAGLVGLGLASFPERFGWRTILVFCALSSFVTLATDQFLGVHHLPSLSLPYVLTLWLAMLSRSPRVSISWAPLPARKPVAEPVTASVVEAEKAA